eukprot:gene3230-3507_t
MGARGAHAALRSWDLEVAVGWFRLQRLGSMWEYSQGEVQELLSREGWREQLPDDLRELMEKRLLLALATTQRSLKFWQARLVAGSHSSFMLLSRGPSGFITDVLSVLGLRQFPESNIAASDRIEERVVALQLLSTQLAVALAAVHRAAGEQAAEQQQEVEETLGTLLSQTAQLQQYETSVKQIHQTAVLQTFSSSFIKHGLLDQPQQVYRATGAGSSCDASSGEGANNAVHHLQQHLADVSVLLGVLSPQQLAAAGKGNVAAGTALTAASGLAAGLGALVPVPAWAAMPSTLQRHWIRYGVAAGLGVSGAMFLYRHSRLAGSQDLENWAGAAVAAVRATWKEHVVQPLVLVRDELFKTFRDSSAGGGRLPLEQLMDADAVNQGMQVVMRCYEQDLKQPIRNLVQRLKLDTEAAMLELDQILRANELSISLVAAVPALLLSGSLLRGLWGLLSPSPPDPRREALPCR